MWWSIPRTRCSSPFLSASTHKECYFNIFFMLTCSWPELLTITNSTDTLLYSSVSWNCVQNLKANRQAVLVLAVREHGNLWFLFILLLAIYQALEAFWPALWHHFEGWILKRKQWKGKLTMKIYVIYVLPFVLNIAFVNKNM